MSIKHTRLNQICFALAMKETETFKKFENFKKGIVSERKNTDYILFIS